MLDLIHFTCISLSSGVPSVPAITGVTAGKLLFTVNVKLYAGHASLNFNVSIISEQNTVIQVLSDTQTGNPSGLMSYTIAVPFSKLGRHRFTVSASNQFGKSATESDVYPPTEINGLEGNDDITEIFFNSECHHNY